MFWRDSHLVELNCGRSPGWNPILSNAITVYRVFDHSIGQFRPLVVPVTQLIDPFNEVTFHSNQLKQEIIEPKLLNFYNHKQTPYDKTFTDTCWNR